MSELQIMWDMIVPLIIAGISIGIVLSIVAGSIKIGWKLAPYLIVISLIIWYIQI
tara:strand:- start:563 stop:727 length:165 start_codon:yes stop_codon:yes gene_type:complete